MAVVAEPEAPEEPEVAEPEARTPLPMPAMPALRAPAEPEAAAEAEELPAPGAVALLVAAGQREQHMAPQICPQCFWAAAEAVEPEEEAARAEDAEIVVIIRAEREVLAGQEALAERAAGLYSLKLPRFQTAERLELMVLQAAIVQMAAMALRELVRLI